MPTVLKTKSLYYNDVNLISTKRGMVNSRSEIPRELDRIFVSAMSAVIGEKFIQAAAPLGIGVCLHRFCDISEQVKLFNCFIENGGKVENIFPSVGFHDSKNIDLFLKGASVIPENILTDVAFCLIPKLKNYIKDLYSTFQYKKILIGNIQGSEGLKNVLEDIYINDRIKYIIRVGTGGGAACSSSDITGINRGQITELIECFDYIQQNNLQNVEIVADGGIAKSGYAAKAFGAGADRLMMGGFFTQAIEAETNVSGDGSYWGMASDKQQILTKGYKYRHSEGKVLSLERKLVPLKDLINEFFGGINSGVSYSGYSTLTDFIGNGVFEIKQNSLPPKNR